MLSPAAAPVSSHTTDDQFIVGNQFVAAASPFLFCIPRVGVFQHGAGVLRPLWGLVWKRIDTSADVPMALPSCAGVRSWGAGGCSQCQKAPFLPWVLPLLPQCHPASSGVLSGILPSVDIAERKDPVCNHGLVILGKRGGAGGGPAAPGAREGTMGPLCSQTLRLPSARSSEGFSARFYSPVRV